MNTERSTKFAERHLQRNSHRRRKRETFSRTFDAAASVVFPQLCPTRELDWIDGWQCELVYTESGYVEADCIFTTPASNSLGPGLWAVTRYEPNRILELVRVINDTVLLHFRIDLIDHGDGTCTGTWNLVYTALNANGDAMVNELPDLNPALQRAMEGLDHFVNTGELLLVE